MFKILSKVCKTKQNIDLKLLCSIHIGGVGEFVCFPNSIRQLKKLMAIIKKNKLEYFIVGNGTNIVFEDQGFKGVIVCLKEMSNFKINKNTITCEAGLNLFALNFVLKQEGLGGLEWSFGIPASVGGAVFMNAGAYGFEIKDFLKEVWVLSGGKVKKHKIKKLKFGYRQSPFKESGEIVVKASFNLCHKDTAEIEKRQNEIFAYRKCCQPYGTYNAGSIFKKANGESAGKTIDKLGLKNVKIGQMQISEKHANFFVNLGGATSADLHKLINHTKQIVKQRANIDLQEEIIFVKNKGNKL